MGDGSAESVRVWVTVVFVPCPIECGDSSYCLLLLALHDGTSCVFDCVSNLADR